jgi:OPT family oligopeptide transporter
LGLGAITLDWQYVLSFTTALTSPFIYTLNSLGGNLLYFYLIIPILYYSNVFRADNIYNSMGSEIITDPNHGILNSVLLFNKTGKIINPKDFYNLTDFSLNMTAYEKESPIYITESFAITYMANFAAITAMITHVFLWHRKSIVKQCKLFFQKDSPEKGIHSNLMKTYPRISNRFSILFLAFFLSGFIFVTQTTAFKAPLSGVFFGTLMTIIFLLPIGIIYGITGVHIGTNVISEVVFGYIYPGQVIPVMNLKTFVDATSIQSIALIQDLKIGHYMKIPPRSLFGMQFLGAFIGSVTSMMTAWMMMTVPYWLKKLSNPSSDWNQVTYTRFSTASAIWGAIGTERFFGRNSPYFSILLIGFIGGFLLSFVPYLGNKVRPSKFWKMINVPVIIYQVGAGMLQVTLVTPFIVAFIFQFWIFRYHKDWFKKYMYIFASAISFSVALTKLSIEFYEFLKLPSFPIYFLNPDSKKGAFVDYYCRDIPFIGDPNFKSRPKKN